ncbi:MAG: hypothetical protein SVR08_15750 [Spirochaetota bacterium]|nr:hypothetical protein [Spirochaetota bacterium]
MSSNAGGGTVFNTRNPYASKVATERSKNPRTLSAPMWDRATATVGEEVTLLVNITNQYQGANVYFTIWKDDADRDKDMPVAKVYGHHDNGKAEAKTRFRVSEMDSEVDESKFIFTEKSFLCKEVESGSITIKKVKPEFSDQKWMLKDENGNETEVNKAKVGDIVKFTANVKNMEDGEKVKIKIYEKDYQSENDFICEEEVEVKEEKIEYEWKVEYHEDFDDINSKKEQEEKGYTIPEYIFKIESNDYGVTSDNSPVIEGVFWIYSQLVDIHTDEILKNTEYTLHFSDGSSKKGKTDGEGYLDEKDIKLDEYYITVKEN